MPVDKLHHNYVEALTTVSLDVSTDLKSGTSLEAQNATFNEKINVGSMSEDLRTTDHYTAPVAVLSYDNPDNYAQIAFKAISSGQNSSADYIAYPDNGNDDYGYIDMGITSSTFTDPLFTITGKNDGYIFMVSPKLSLDVISASYNATTGNVTITTIDDNNYNLGDVVRIELKNAFSYQYYNATITSLLTARSFIVLLSATTQNLTGTVLTSADVPNIASSYQSTGKGNLVFATDATGSANNIVFAAGGLATDTSQMIIYPNNKVNINIATASTSTSTGALVVNGGVGIGGSLNVASSIAAASLGINGQTPAFKLDIQGGILGNVIGNQIQVFRLNGIDNNVSSLEFTETRTAAGSSWTTSGFRMQQKIDATWMGWQQFTTDLNNSGISWGTGSSTVSPTSITEKLRLDSTGNLNILSGTLTVGSTATISGSSIAINGATPTISSTNVSAASIFTGTVTGITIGSSSINTTVYPATGTTSTLDTASRAAGYIGLPQVAIAATGAQANTFAATDAGKHYYVTGTPTSVTLTIPANGTVPFPIGATIIIMNDLGAATNISIAITTDTLQLAGTGTTGTRTLARYGVATLTKVTSTKWIISGNGLT